MADSGGPTVLVVDDDEAVAEVYSRQLEKRYTVDTAYDGENALDAVTEEIDVVLLDRRMAGLSGGEVVEVIRDRGLDCGVVMVTAVDPGFDIVDMGFDDYLIKPVTEEELHDAVEETYERVTGEQQMRKYLAVASKIATLRTEKNSAQLEASDEYARLQERFERLQNAVDISDVDVEIPVDQSRF
jgi:DNA-binding response OmpR family regulator